MTISYAGFVKKIRNIMRMDQGVNGDAQRIEQLVWILFLKIYDAKENDWEFDEDDFHSIIPENCRWRRWAHQEDKKGMTGDELLDFVNNTLFPTLKNLNVTQETPTRKAIVKTVFQDANQYMKNGIYLRQIVDEVDAIDFEDSGENHAFGEIYESILKELQSAGSAGEFYTPRPVTEFMARMVRPRLGETMADLACGTGGFLTSWLQELQKQVRTVEDQEKYAQSIYGMEKKPFPYMLCITNLLLHDVDRPRVEYGNSLSRNLLDYTQRDAFNVILMNPPYGGHEDQSIKNHFPKELQSSETADLFMALIMQRLKKDGRAAVVLPDGFLFGQDNTKVALKKELLGEFNLHTVVRLPASVFAPYTSITTNILFFDRTHPTEETWFYRLDMPEGYKHFSKTRPMLPDHFRPVEDWWTHREEIIQEEWPKVKCFTAAQLEGENYNLDQCGYPHEEEEILEPLDLIRQYQEKRVSLNAKIDKVLDRITALLEERP